MSRLKATARRAPPRPAALILAIAVTATAGCSAAAPRATDTGSAALDVTPAARTATPVFAGPLVPAHSGTAWAVGAFSSATGQLLRVLTTPPSGAGDEVLSVQGGWVYFTEFLGTGALSVWRVPLTGGPARLVQAGTNDYAVSPDGRMAAYVATVDQARTSEVVVVVANLVTGRRHTIIMVTNRPGVTPVGVNNLAWAPDDIHLAAEIDYAAFASDVMVFNAGTARTMSDGRTVPCPGACAAKLPSYLRTGTLTYLTERLFENGNGITGSAITLMSWAGGHPARLVTIWDGRGGLPFVWGETTTPQGTAIWVLATQTWAGGRYTVRDTIWRWSGGKPVKVRALPPVMVTWLPFGGGIA
jgi:hypothetical protein